MWTLFKLHPALNDVAQTHSVLWVLQAEFMVVANTLAMTPFNYSVVSSNHAMYWMKVSEIYYIYRVSHITGLENTYDCFFRIKVSSEYFM